MRIIFVILFVCTRLIVFSQIFGLDVLGGKTFQKLRFQPQNGLIVIKLVLNDKIPLQFIFDTGAQNTILFDRAYANIAHLEFDDKIRILGSDLNGYLYADIARNVKLSVGELPDVTRDIVVLDEDYFNLSEVIGTNIHGILGTDFFKALLVHINYDKNYIKFYDPSEYNYQKLKDYQKTDIEVIDKKAYVNCKFDYEGTTSVRKMLIDTGAALPLMLHSGSEGNIKIPENAIQGYLGKGLGGDLFGHAGIIDNFKFVNSNFDNIVCNFQQIDTTIIKLEDIHREGIIGNYLLSKFNIFLDFRNYKLYIKPSKSYKEEFKINKSGLSLIATGLALDEFLIISVRKSSPAHLLGLEKGDIIKCAGSWLNPKNTLGEILDYLSQEEGKKVNIKVLKKNETKEKRYSLTLKNPFRKEIIAN